MRQVHRWALTVRALSRLARSFDVVCSWQVKGHYYGTPAARIARKPALWWDHGIRPVRGEPSAFAGGAIPRALHADLVLTSSRIAAARHPRAQAIHPGIDVDAFAHAVASDRSTLGAAHGEPLVGIVGRLQPWKGQHVFLRAAARVVQSNSHARFAVVGDAIGGFSRDYPEHLRELAASLGIADRVCFAGERRDVAGVMKALDVFVHASTDEPFGIVVVESLAAGTPVVATRGGGVPEIVSDGENGFLVPAGDDAAMASRIGALLSDDALRRRFAAAGRERAARDFTAARMVDDLTLVLERIAGRVGVSA
jgi:glycosyltransferase involved in cell wall biosynthesis